MPDPRAQGGFIFITSKEQPSSYAVPTEDMLPVGNAPVTEGIMSRALPSLSTIAKLAMDMIDPALQADITAPEPTDGVMAEILQLCTATPQPSITSASAKSDNPIAEPPPDNLASTPETNEGKATSRNTKVTRIVIKAPAAAQQTGPTNRSENDNWAAGQCNPFESKAYPIDYLLDKCSRDWFFVKWIDRSDS